MIRALQTAGVHTWVIFRVAFSRKYWLGTTAALYAAGAFLWLFAALLPPHLVEWGDIDWLYGGESCSDTSGLEMIVAFAIGVAILPWCRPEFAESPPLPIRNSLRRLLATVLALFLAVFMAMVAIPLMVVLFVLIYVAIDGGLALISLDPFAFLEGISKTWRTKQFYLNNMGIGALSAFPVCLVLSGVFPKRTNAKRGLRDVLPLLLGLGLAAVGTALAIDALEHHQVCQHYTTYLSIWLVGFIFAFCVEVLNFSGQFLPSLWRDMHRKGLAGPQQLMASLKRSQLIKMKSVLFACAMLLFEALFGVVEGLRNVLRGLENPYAEVMATTVVVSCYLIFVVMPVMLTALPLASTFFTNTRRLGRASAAWNWEGSGWSLVPVSRKAMQKYLLLDVFGFAILSTLLFHTAVYLETETIGRDFTILAKGYSILVGVSLPLAVVGLFPRRRFGLGLTALACFSAFWTLRTANFGFGSSNSTLVFKLHLLQVGIWVLLWAAALRHTQTPTGGLIASSNRVVRWAIAIGSATAVLIGIFVHNLGLKVESTSVRTGAYITRAQTDRLVDDLKAIDALNVFAAASGERDAGPLLNPHIGTIYMGTERPAWRPMWWSDPDKPALLKRPDAHWTTAPEDLAVGDLSLLNRLLEFDHWEAARGRDEIDSKDDATGRYEQERYGTAWNTTEPNPVPLITLAKFRLVDGLRSDDMLAALKEVRHFAQLVYSDEATVSTMTAIAILRAEKDAVIAARERGLLQPEDWTEVSEDELNALTRAALSLAYMMARGSRTHEWDRIHTLPFTPFGLCGATGEIITHSLAEPPVRLWPGEYFPSKYGYRGFLSNGVHGYSGLFNSTLGTERCRIPEVRDHLEHRSSKTWRKALRRRKASDTTMMLLTIPYVRGHAWIKTRFFLPPPHLLKYGDTPEEDWGRALPDHPGPLP